MVQPCFPNWMQIVWSWWGAHPSSCSDSIQTPEPTSSRSRAGMIALNARIQTAKAVAKRSTRRLFSLTMLTIPSTLGRDQEGVNGVMGGGVPSQDRSPWVFLWLGRCADSGVIPRGNARSIRDLNALP